MGRDDSFLNLFGVLAFPFPAHPSLHSSRRRWLKRLVEVGLQAFGQKGFTGTGKRVPLLKKMALLNDANGLCLVKTDTSEADGENDKDSKSDTSGLHTTILRTAASLAPPGSDETPTVLIETDKRTIVLKEYDSLTVSIDTTAQSS